MAEAVRLLGLRCSFGADLTKSIGSSKMRDAVSLKHLSTLVTASFLFYRALRCTNYLRTTKLSRKLLYLQSRYLYRNSFFQFGVRELRISRSSRVESAW